MTDHDPKDPLHTLGEALEGQTAPDLEDQGDIAADDAGATALAERVAKSAGVEAQDPAAD